MDMKSKNSLTRISNVVKMLQGEMPKPRRKSAGGNQFEQQPPSSEDEDRVDMLQLTKKKKQPYGRPYAEIKKYRKLK